jgi:hypothetical protein
MMVAMALITTFMTTPLLDRFGGRSKQAPVGGLTSAL